MNDEIHQFRDKNEYYSDVNEAEEIFITDSNELATYRVHEVRDIRTQIYVMFQHKRRYLFSHTSF